MKELLRYYFPYFKRYKKELAIALSGMVMVAVGTAASAHLLKPVLDDLFIRKDRDMLVIVTFAIVAVFGVKSLGKFLQTYYTVYIGNDIVRIVRNRLASHLMAQDMGYLNRMRSGELLSRMLNDITRIQNVVSSLIPQMTINAMLIVVLTCYVIWQSPKLAFYFLVIMPLALFPLQLLARRMKKYSKRSQQSAADMTMRLSEIFNNIEVIKSNSSQDFESKRFKHDNASFFRHSMKQYKTLALVSPVLEFFGSIAIAVAIYVGANEVISGSMTVGSFFAFITALFMLYDPIKKLSNVHNQMQDAVAATERLQELLSIKPTIVSGKKALTRIDTIRFEKVTLRYEDKEALQSIDLEAHKGKTYALVGDSGGGKSSFVNLLVRFYDPTQGRILINGEPIESFTLASLHRRIGYVTQRIFIFNDTIARNVAYAEEADEAQVIKALKKAHAWEFVSALPQGIHTPLDEGGANLSGGQRQRIALARALYKQPDVLILDEATSALDNKSEAAVQAALKEIKDEMITFIVAHRLSTVKDADEILVFEKGSIVARGSYKTLLRQSQAFQALATKG